MSDSVADELHNTSATASVSVASDDPMAGLAFSQVARLELDELLDQLMNRARDVQDAQGRLRGLLRRFSRWPAPIASTWCCAMLSRPPGNWSTPGTPRSA